MIIEGHGCSTKAVVFYFEAFEGLSALLNSYKHLLFKQRGPFPSIGTVPYTYRMPSRPNQGPGSGSRFARGVLFHRRKKVSFPESLRHKKSKTLLTLIHYFYGAFLAICFESFSIEKVHLYQRKTRRHTVPITADTVPNLNRALVALLEELVLLFSAT